MWYIKSSYIIPCIINCVMPHTIWPWCVRLPHKRIWYWRRASTAYGQHLVLPPSSPKSRQKIEEGVEKNWDITKKKAILHIRLLLSCHPPDVFNSASHSGRDKTQKRQERAASERKKADSVSNESRGKKKNKNKRKKQKKTLTLTAMIATAAYW